MSSNAGQKSKTILNIVFTMASVGFWARTFKCLWGPGIDSKEWSLWSLAGRYDNPIPPRFLAPIDFLKIPALYSWFDLRNWILCATLGNQSPYFWTFMEPRNRFHGTNSASLWSLAGRYDNPIPTRFPAPIDCLKIPALELLTLLRIPFL